MMMDDTRGNGHASPVDMTGPITELTPLAQPGPMTEMERFIFECWGYLISRTCSARPNAMRPWRPPSACMAASRPRSSSRSAAA